ncbi:MAG: hypothetical protein WCA79_08615 [Anaerolineales bacterium]
MKEHYTIVIATHALRPAKGLADYVIYMYLGKVVEAGPAHRCLIIHNTNERAHVTKDNFNQSSLRRICVND